MRYRLFVRTALGALLVLAASALAFAFAAVATAHADMATGFTAPATTSLPPRLEGLVFRPRAHPASPPPSHPYHSAGPQMASPVQLHFGFFEPEGRSTTGFTMGMRGGPLVDRHLQIGGGTDWQHKSEDVRVVSGDPFNQGGTTITPERVLSHSSNDLLPVYGFFQLNLLDDARLVPYGGASAGYQWLFVSATDYQTGSHFDATFGGWMWEAWAGLAIPLSGQSRLTSEVFMHEGNAEREVIDPYSLVAYRERVELNSVGMRFGLSWGF
jgi:hypothetical protein